MPDRTIGGDVTTETVRIRGHQGDEIPAYLAHPAGPGPFPGVVVLHHMPGFDEATKETTRTFAAHGYTAIMPNLHWRNAPGASPDAAAAHHPRALPSANGKVGVIGYCSGGRQTFWPPAACPWTRPSTATAPSSWTRRRTASCSGSARSSGWPATCPARCWACSGPTTPAVPGRDRPPRAGAGPARQAFEFHTYLGAGHGFFTVDRPSYRPEAAADGWQRIWDWFGRYLAA
jgi:carboxymethylenebutenolidase